MNILPDFVSPVNEQFQPGAAITLRRPQPRRFVQAGELVAAWDTTISYAGTVSRTAITAEQFFVLVTPDPTAGFGEFAFYPHELRAEVAQ